MSIIIRITRVRDTNGYINGVATPYAYFEVERKREWGRWSYLGSGSQEEILAKLKPLFIQPITIDLQGKTLADVNAALSSLASIEP